MEFGFAEKNLAGSNAKVEQHRSFRPCLNRAKQIQKIWKIWTKTAIGSLHSDKNRCKVAVEIGDIGSDKNSIKRGVKKTSHLFLPLEIQPSLIETIIVSVYSITFRVR